MDKTPPNLELSLDEFVEKTPAQPIAAPPVDREKLLNKLREREAYKKARSV